jgi:prepilin-type N-terminal cleavage/methylation domain-containing protein
MKNFKDGFTLIEVLVSVMLISIVILGLMKINSQTQDMTIYITQREKAVWTDSLFLYDDIKEQANKEINAYDMLLKRYKLSNDESISILKEAQRKIYIEEQVEDENASKERIFDVEQVKLGGDFASVFYLMRLRGDITK